MNGHEIFWPFSNDNSWKHFSSFFLVANLNKVSSDGRAKMENKEASEKKLKKTGWKLPFFQRILQISMSIWNKSRIITFFLYFEQVANCINQVVFAIKKSGPRRLFFVLLIYAERGMVKFRVSQVSCQGEYTEQIPQEFGKFYVSFFESVLHPD